VPLRRLPFFKIKDMKTIKFKWNNEVRAVTDRYAEQLIEAGKATEVKEEKVERETKEEKQAPKRATKKK
jgi:hypothetical protein